jgi:DNA repair protein RadC
MPALEAQLALRREVTARLLRAAVALDAPTAETLGEAGLARWDALALMRTLTAAGEVTPSGWEPAARAAYQALLTSPGTLERREEADRPREKAIRAGIDALDDAELVALLLRTGSGDEDVLELATRLLSDHGGLAGLARKRVEELAGERGLGPAKAGELAAACELGRRLATAALRERPVLATPEATAALLAPLASALGHEEFWCLPLDPRSRLIGEPRVIARGDVDGTDAPPRAFLRATLIAGATAAIAVHNHPTGDPTPSAADLAATRRLVAAGRAVDITVHDHLVLGDGGRFTSLRRDHPECWR